MIDEAVTKPEVLSPACGVIGRAAAFLTTTPSFLLTADDVLPLMLAAPMPLLAADASLMPLLAADAFCAASDACDAYAAFGS
eukprot:365743-Chlamydomonas_euryale.AAC.15